jgi:hypothetical protein
MGRGIGLGLGTETDLGLANDGFFLPLNNENRPRFAPPESTLGSPNKVYIEFVKSV